MTKSFDVFLLKGGLKGHGQAFRTGVVKGVVSTGPGYLDCSNSGVFALLQS